MNPVSTPSTSAEFSKLPPLASVFGYSFFRTSFHVLAIFALRGASP
jgi:hypothetical protein